MLAVCLLALNSCKKSSTNPQTATNLSLKFNGTAYSYPSATASYNASQNAIQIIGNLNNADVIYVVIPQNLKVGTFDIASGGAAVTFSTSTTNDQDSYIATSGSVVITSFTSSTIAGTFQATCSSLANVAGTVTEGKFQLKYTSQ